MAKEKENSKGQVVSNGKEISVLKKESKSLSRILGDMKQELDVLTTAINAQQASERETKKHCHDDKQNRTVATFIQSCWRQLLARKELQRLQKEVKELSILLVGDSRMNRLEERGKYDPGKVKFRF
jgi:predicted RNase H-like nuclease (RuvC/YqgF family)